MPKKPKPPARPKFHCHYTERSRETVQFLRDIEGEFVCPSCNSVLKQGKVYFCYICKSELGACCHTKISDKHTHRNESFDSDLSDYIPLDPCEFEGMVRCRCCDRFLCLGHARKGDLSRTSLLNYDGEKLVAAVLCPDCKDLLDPDPEPESDDGQQEPSAFQDDWALKSFLRTLGR